MIDAVVDTLVSSPLLTIFLVVAVGSALGALPLGRLRLGAAGALFVGLAVGALDPRLGEGLGLVQSLGLALFVYTVGLSAGTTFFRELKRFLPFMGASVAVLVVAAGSVVLVAPLLGLPTPLALGTFAGALTSTPALSAATVATGGSPEAAVGYALAYPVGVVVGLTVIAVVLTRRFPARRDAESLAGAGLQATSLRVQADTNPAAVPLLAAGQVRISYLARGGVTRVFLPGDQLLAGDWIVVVGAAKHVAQAAAALGEETDTHLADYRHEVDHLRFVVSNKHVIGRTVGELDFPGRFHGTIMRVRRGDLDLLANESLTLQPGDRVLAVVPAERLDDVRQLFGDSERRLSEIDPVAVGLGLALGLAVGLLSVPLGGGLTFSLGAAAGPLLVGTILGHFERTGPFGWQLPYAANLTIRQVGLLLFLACVGLGAGPAFMREAFTFAGVKVIAFAALLCGVTCLLFALAARLLGFSSPRTAGGLGAVVGQPALVAAANLQVSDERIDAGYATLYALCIVTKVLLVYLMVALLGVGT